MVPQRIASLFGKRSRVRRNRSPSVWRAMSVFMGFSSVSTSKVVDDRDDFELQQHAALQVVHQRVASRAVVRVGETLEPFGIDVFARGVVFQIDRHAYHVLQAGAASGEQ